MPVWDDDGKCIAGLFYTYYERSDVRDRAVRRLVISFNGGPGSASVWMQIAYTGPRLINIDDEGYPIHLYGIKENPYSFPDVADIVFVNPVNTAHSSAMNSITKPISNTSCLEMFFPGITAITVQVRTWDLPKRTTPICMY